MKKIKIGIIVLSLVMLAGLVLFSSGATAAKPAPKEIDKVVFVHYPQPQGNAAYWAPAKAPAPTDDNTRYKYTGIHWASSNIAVGYLVNSSGGPSGAENAVITAFQTWENESNSAMDFNSGGSTTSNGGILDEKNIVSWADISTQYPGAIAVTIVWYYRGSKEIVEADTIMNLADPWAVNTGITDPDTETGTTTAYDVQNIMTHEAGHWLMLGDLYQWKTQKLTMYGYGEMGELQKRTLGAGDELGIERIY